ncbi:MAG: hypothetical protein R6V19_14900 [Armatimonadota bacterium]
MEFSEESKLLIEHWGTCEEILEVAERLEQQELPAIREEIMEDIEEADWAEAWEMEDSNPHKFIMYRPEWIYHDEPIVRIGFSKLWPDRVFGSSTPPLLWVRVEADYRELLVVPLLDALKERDAILGKPRRKTHRKFMIEKPVQKCPPEAIDHYQENLSHQVMTFFEHYCRVLWDLNDIIQTKLGELE